MRVAAYSKPGPKSSKVKSTEQPGVKRSITLAPVPVNVTVGMSTANTALPNSAGRTVSANQALRSIAAKTLTASQTLQNITPRTLRANQILQNITPRTLTANQALHNITPRALTANQTLQNIAARTTSANQLSMAGRSSNQTVVNSRAANLGAVHGSRAANLVTVQGSRTVARPAVTVATVTLPPRGITPRQQAGE